MRVYQHQTAHKLAISGLIMEKWYYQDASLNYGNFEDGHIDGKPYIFKDNDAPKTADFEYSLVRNEINRKRRFERLVNANVDTYRKPNSSSVYPPVLLTLTYGTQQENLQQAKDDLNLFVKRLNYNLDDASLKYLAVPELMENKRVHFHNLFFNLPYVKQAQLQDCWGNGFVDVRRVDRVRSMGNYMTKYLQKGFRGESNKNKSYYCSKRLKKPVIIYDQQKVQNIFPKLLKNSHQIFKKSYYSIWHGYVNYSVFRLPVDDAIASIINA